MTKAYRKARLRREKLVEAGKAGRRGAEPTVTIEVVERVGKRMARGLPLHYSLALEDTNISLDVWHKALQRSDKLSTLLDRHKGDFIDKALDRLSSGEMADLKWLLSRRHPDLFAEKPEAAAGPADQAIAGMQELINRSRELAKLKQVDEGAQ